ncbi:MAG: transcriptional repressor NrdR [Deltaproteobacteria bacterium]|nr:transcriptional repressor NrdR [Deltaproteobacteria bacterium]MBI3078496.1 transcriptional repressor NrdR [Deltaproteobacteria bacterium]
MRCPFCASADLKVIDSRASRDGKAIRRRRECLGCHKRFTTYERVEETLLPLIVKRDGRREPYDRGKVIGGLQKACEKRPVSITVIEKIADRIEQALQETGEREVPSTEIGERIMQELHALDEVAYVRFASVYRQFKDINEFLDEARRLMQERQKGE